MLTRRRFLAQSAAALPFLGMAAQSNSAQRKPLMIDSHVHVFKRDPQFPYAKGAKPPADAPVDEVPCEVTEVVCEVTIEDEALAEHS